MVIKLLVISGARLVFPVAALTWSLNLVRDHPVFSWMLFRTTDFFRLSWPRLVMCPKNCSIRWIFLHPYPTLHLKNVYFLPLKIKFRIILEDQRLDKMNFRRFSGLSKLCSVWHLTFGHAVPPFYFSLTPRSKINKIVYYCTSRSDRASVLMSWPCRSTITIFVLAQFISSPNILLSCCRHLFWICMRVVSEKSFSLFLGYLNFVISIV